MQEELQNKFLEMAAKLWVSEETIELIKTDFGIASESEEEIIEEEIGEEQMSPSLQDKLEKRGRGNQF